MSFSQCFKKSSKIILLFIVVKLIVKLLFDFDEVKLFMHNISNAWVVLVVVFTIVAIWLMLTLICSTLYYFYKNRQY